MTPTAPVKIDKRPFSWHGEQAEWNLLDVSNPDTGNPYDLIEYDGRTFKLTGTNSNWMAAYYTMLRKVTQ